jgi:hypothetical protein
MRKLEESSYGPYPAGPAQFILMASPAHCCSLLRSRGAARADAQTDGNLDSGSICSPGASVCDSNRAWGYFDEEVLVDVIFCIALLGGERRSACADGTSCRRPAGHRLIRRTPQNPISWD